MKIEVRAIRNFYADDGKRPFRMLATADVYLPELTLTIREAALTWSRKDGFIVMAPMATTKDGHRPMTWHHQSAFGKQLAEAIAKAWRGMGGQLPEERPEPVIFRRNDDGKIVGLASEEIEYRTVPATFHVHEDADDAEAVDGLARTLSVEQAEALRVLG